MKINLVFRSFRKDLLDDLLEEIADLAVELEILFGGPIPLPVRRRRFTVNRSPHIYKKSREQFEIATHSRLVVLESAVNESVLDFIRVVESIVSGGVELKIRIIR